MDIFYPRIDELRKKLKEYNQHYYVLSKPVISDFEYDKLMEELEELEKTYPEYRSDDSPTQRVGSDLSKGFKQRTHKYPMLSLSNTYSEEEVLAFYNRINKLLEGAPFELVCELKYDGTSLSAIYKNGELAYAVTRGDGEKGDDITRNVKMITSIPQKLKGDVPKELELRGEILMPWAEFDRLNKKREEQEETPFANPRNAASGTIKLLNSKIVKERRLSAFFYYLLLDEKIEPTHYKSLQRVKSWGCNVSEATQSCKTIEDVFAFLKKWDIARKELPVATDGVVIKVNDLNQQKALGYTAKSPRWAIAYKFKAEQATSTLFSVSYQVGRTGTITPVANLKAVLLSGTTVKRASLHNDDFIQKMDLHINDQVFVEKGGEIIPKIVGVDLNQRFLIGEKIKFITTCPECNTPLVRDEKEAAFYCPNRWNCPPQIKGRIVHFISRKAMNIDGLGEEKIELFYQKGLIHDVADLYHLKAEQLLSLDGFRERSVKTILANIKASKQVPFNRVLFALGIRYVGITTAKKIATALPSLEKIIAATQEELMAIDEVGERIANSLIAFLQEEKNKLILARLQEAGLQMELNLSKALKGSNKLENKSIVISGTFELHSRDEYKAMIELHGGKNSAAVSSKTDYLLAGNKIGPSKLTKAQKMGVKIINEGEFLSQIK